MAEERRAPGGWQVRIRRARGRQGGAWPADLAFGFSCGALGGRASQGPPHVAAYGLVASGWELEPEARRRPGCPRELRNFGQHAKEKP